MGLNNSNNGDELSGIYGWETALPVKKAADMFFSLSYFEDAFRLYRSLWNDLGSDSQPSSFKSSILAACVRSAVTVIDLSDALKLLENEQLRLDTRKSHMEDVELIKLQIMFAEIYQRRGDDTLARHHAVLASKIGLDREATLAGTCQSTGIDFSTYSHISRYFIFAGLDACQTDDSALRMKTPEDQNLIWEWFTWSADQLNCEGEVPRFWVTLFEDSQNLKWSQSAAIYCFLWMRWIAQDMEGAPGSTLPDQTYDMIGISIAEILAVICFTITEESTSISKPSPYISRYSTFNGSGLFGRAAAAAETLLMSSHETLALKFFETLTRQNHLLNFREAENLARGEARAIVNDFIQDTLHIILPDPPTPMFLDQHPVLSHAQDERVTRQSQLSDARSSMWNPRLASSIRSSSQSLLRKLKRRIEQERSSGSQRYSKISWPSSIGRYSLFGIATGQRLTTDDLSDAMSIISITNSEN